MCATCGCGDAQPHVLLMGEPAEHHHEPHSHGPRHEPHPNHRQGHPHGDGQPAGPTRKVTLEADLLAANDALAAANRDRFAEAGVFVLNLLSSPGSGKTTLLVETIARLARLADPPTVAVIEGDQQTANDAERIHRTGVPVVQVNTGKGCHLDADMVARAADRLPLRAGGVLFVENVGNLVCPAGFDLGESAKVVILSVTEGEDKPVKYPDMFRAADLMLLNKCDLMPHLDVDPDRAEAYARTVNPQLRSIRTSATQGLGLDEWVDWVTARAVRVGRAG